MFHFPMQWLVSENNSSVAADADHSQNTTQQQQHTYMSIKGSHWTGKIKKKTACHLMRSYDRLTVNQDQVFT